MHFYDHLLSIPVRVLLVCSDHAGNPSDIPAHCPVLLRLLVYLHGIGTVTLTLASVTSFSQLPLLKLIEKLV